MNALQEITDAWGNWFSQQNGTSCRYTASTNYGSQDSLNDYHQYQTSADVQSFVYDGNSLPTNGSAVAYELWYDNGTTLQQQNTFAETQSSTQTFTWSVTETLSVGVEISATEGVPAVASSSQKVSVNVSLSSTQAQTATQTQSWTVNTPINVPPDRSVKADMLINSQTYDIDFTASVLLAGRVAIWNNDQVNGHWLWFYPVENVVQDCIDHGIIDTTGYEVVAGGVMTQATGVFTGSQGVSVGVQAKEYPLRNRAATSGTEQAVRSLISPLAIPAAD